MSAPSSSSSSSSWQPPSWSHIPPTTQQWHLDELKNGHVVATHSLNDILTDKNSSRRCITFGRLPNPSQIDIQTAHESCSRLHARIAFTVHGIPYLKDLGSNNGTFVNNVRLPIEACGKWEFTADDEKGGSNNDNDSNVVNREARGSRGVVIYPGDAIKFGCSTRIFVLEGPEEFERGGAAAASSSVLSSSSQSQATNVTVAADESLQEKRSSDEQHEAALLDVAEKNEDNDNAICSWGMSIVECSDEQQQQQQQEEKQGELNSNSNNNLPSMEAFFSSSNTTYNNIKYTISNPLQQLYNQYQTKSYKYNSISNESQRISQKEDGGVELSDGQRNQLGKNQERLRVLEGSLKELQRKIEEGMYVAIYGKVPTSASSRGRRRKGDDDDGYTDENEDDFYDRTTTTTANGNYKDKEAESEESLIQKWKDLLQSYSKQQNVLSSTIKRSNELQRQIDQAEDDDEDVFFIQNDLNLVKENITKATCRVEEITKELHDTECLLKIVNDKLKWDREEGLIGVDLPIKAAKTKKACGDDGEIQEKKATMDTDIFEEEEQKSEPMMMPPPPKMIPSASSAAARSFDMMPPPPAPPPKGTMNAASSMTMTSANEIEGVVIPEHRESLKKTTVGETVSRESVNQQQQPLLGPTQNKKRQLGPMRPPPTSTTGTLAALQQFSASPNDPNNTKKQKKSKCDNSDSGNAISFNSSQQDVWTAPTDQDGSGRTSLHDKFKGRY